MEEGAESMNLSPYKHTSDHYAARSLAADMDEWIIYECDKMEESLEEWLEENHPSQIHSIMDELAESMNLSPYKHTSDHYAAEILAADMDEWIFYDFDKMEESLEERLKENAP